MALPVGALLFALVFSARAGLIALLLFVSALAAARPRLADGR